MMRPTLRWFAAGCCLLVVAACDDKKSEEPESEEHGDHAHEEPEGDEHAHGGASDSAGKSGGSAGKGGASARADANETKEVKAGAGGKGAGGKPAEPEKSKPVAESGGMSGKEAGTGGKAAGTGGMGGSADPEPAAGSGGGSSAAADSDVTIRFKAKLADKAFACGTTYEKQGNPPADVTPQDLRLFIQDLALIQEDGTRVAIKNAVREPWQSETVALLDFEDATGNCAGTPETNDQITGTIPAGTYTGLSFASGVPEALNHADPTTQTDPLKSSAALSWSWLGGFRFAKIELVKTDSENFGEGVFHPGSNACSGNPSAGQVTCAKPNRNEVVIDKFDPVKDTVVIDLTALFAHTDLNMDSACHSGEKAICESMFDAWGTNFADGKPKAGQTVFTRE